MGKNRKTSLRDRGGVLAQKLSCENCSYRQFPQDFLFHIFLNEIQYDLSRLLISIGCLKSPLRVPLQRQNLHFIRTIGLNHMVFPVNSKRFKARSQTFLIDTVRMIIVDPDISLFLHQPHLMIHASRSGSPEVSDDTRAFRQTSH